MFFSNKKCKLYRDGRFEVFDKTLQQKFNKMFKTYADGSYSFKEGEEAVFWVGKDLPFLDRQIELNRILSSFLTKKT